jgi:hypothetical protein
MQPCGTLELNCNSFLHIDWPLLFICSQTTPSKATMRSVMRVTRFSNGLRFRFHDVSWISSWRLMMSGRSLLLAFKTASPVHYRAGTVPDSTQETDRAFGGCRVASLCQASGPNLESLGAGSQLRCFLDLNSGLILKQSPWAAQRHRMLSLAEAMWFCM